MLPVEPALPSTQWSVVVSHVCVSEQSEGLSVQPGMQTPFWQTGAALLPQSASMVQVVGCISPAVPPVVPALVGFLCCWGLPQATTARSARTPRNGRLRKDFMTKWLRWL